MWAYHNREEFKDLDHLEVVGTGRRLDVGGFVFTDSFDVFLRNISEQYLSDAWSQLNSLLNYYQLSPHDLSWGMPHPGETAITGKERLYWEPHHYIGWTSEELFDFYLDEKFLLLDEALGKINPQLRCFATWRSLKWKIDPTNYRLALRLIEALCTDELSTWSPNIVLSEHKFSDLSWIKVIKAYSEGNQFNFDQACEEAEDVYSPIGYSIVMRAMRALIQDDKERTKLQIPGNPETA